jgi:hypothetical protein
MDEAKDKIDVCTYVHATKITLPIKDTTLMIR